MRKKRNTKWEQRKEWRRKWEKVLYRIHYWKSAPVSLVTIFACPTFGKRNSHSQTLSRCENWNVFKSWLPKSHDQSSVVSSRLQVKETPKPIGRLAIKVNSIVYIYRKAARCPIAVLTERMLKISSDIPNCSLLFLRDALQLLTSRDCWLVKHAGTGDIV